MQAGREQLSPDCAKTAGGWLLSALCADRGKIIGSWGNVLRGSGRSALLTAAALLLQACPALLEDEYEAVDGIAGASSDQLSAGAGGRSSDHAGASGASLETLAGGLAEDAGQGGLGGTDMAGNAGAAGGGMGGDTNGGNAGASAGSGGAPGGTEGASGSGGAGVAGAEGSGGSRSGGAGGVAGEGSGGVAPGGTGGASAGAAGSGGSSGGEAGAGGTGGVLCVSSPADCEALRDALVHRYSFDGTGTTVTDSVGDADGTVMGGALLTGQGELELAGGNAGEYVDLPNRIISVLDDATIEAWVVRNGGQPFQRVFDFGDAMSGTCVRGGPSAPEGQPGICGRTYLNLMPSTDSDTGGRMRAAFLCQPGVHPDDRLTVDGPTAPRLVELHLAVVVDDSGNQLRLYVDGAPEGSAMFFDHLSDLNDINNWLGRSQFADDQVRAFDGTYLEFRIYDAALTASEVETSFTEGPDAPFFGLSVGLLLRRAAGSARAKPRGFARSYARSQARVFAAFSMW
jgi:hypothetical protein